MQKIVPLDVRVQYAGFVKCFNIVVSLAHFKSVRSIVNQRNKITVLVTFLIILQSFKLSLLTGLSEL